VTDLFAEALAHGDSDAQAAFFNAFLTALDAVCRKADGFHACRAEQQLSFVADGLKPSSRRLVVAWAEMCKLADETDEENRKALTDGYRKVSDLHQEIAKLEQRRREIEEEIERGAA
jgi:hypothetical protein